MSDERESDTDLVIRLGHRNSALPVSSEYFRTDQWDGAIDRAREIAAGRTRWGNDISAVDVIDAWGTAIVRFCPYWLYRNA